MIVGTKNLTPLGFVVGAVTFAIASQLLFASTANAQNRERFERFDTNGDGQLSAEEVNRIPPLKKRLAGADTNRDGTYTLEEIRAHVSGSRNRTMNGTNSERSNGSDKTTEPDRRLVPNYADAGQNKRLPDSDAVRDAAGTGQMFESIHVPGFTDFREGLNGYAFADLDQNGHVDIVTVTTEPFALDATWSDGQGDVQRTRDPRDKLRMLMNFGDFRFQPQEISLTGSQATPNDVSQGWRGGQIPALADFNNDGLYDIFITRQCPMKGGRIERGRTPVGCSLFLAENTFREFRDVSKQYGALNELAYNRSVSLGDVNLDGFLDIALGADNVFNAFEGLPKSALFVFLPQGDRFEDGSFVDIGGTETVPDFGGFFHDSSRDKAGPVISLRDIDNDGDLDLLQSYHVMLPPTMKRLTSYSPGEYRHGVFNWRNLTLDEAEFRFEKVTNNGFACEASCRFNSDARRFEPATDSRAPSLPYLFFGDVNNDSLLDAIAFRMTGFATEKVTSRFWLNRGSYRFEEASDSTQLARLNASYSEWFKFFEADIDTEKLNQPRQSSRVAGSVIGPNRIHQPPQYADAVFADFNNDGWLDLVVVDRLENEKIETRSILFMNLGDGSFEPIPTTISGLDSTGLSAEAVDLNNDGLMDLVVASDPDNSGEAVDARRYESIVYQNTGLHGARENHWLKLKFKTAANARVFGSRIELYQAGSEKLLGSRSIHNNQSYRSSSPPEAHFGLGEISRVDVVVHPLGGKSFRIANVAADRYLAIDLARQIVEEVVLTGRFPKPETNAGNSPAGSIPGFSFLREETFSCGGQEQSVSIFRNDTFAKALGLNGDQTDIACEFILIPRGQFTMGSSQAEQVQMAESRPGRHPIFNSASRFYSRTQESPQHRVDVQPFLLARTEVTQELWRRLAKLAGLPESPSFFNAGKHAPVEQVSWDDAKRWMQAINEAHGLSLRLPTEAEWEYACRAGTTTPIYNGTMTIRGHCDCPELDEIAWYMGNCGVDYRGGVDSSRWREKHYDHKTAGTHSVGQKKENAFGLFDMIGNVMEWCEDHAHADYSNAPTDGSAWLGGNWVAGSSVNGPLSRADSRVGKRRGQQDEPGRVRRGGSWRQLAYNIRSAMRSFRGRDFADSNQGFRVASDLPTGFVDGETPMKQNPKSNLSRNNR